MSEDIIAIVIAVVAIFIFIKLISAPVKLAVKLLLHALSGFLILLVVEIIGGFFDFSLGINFIKCVTAGLLGIPGVVILLALRIFLGI